MLKIIFNLLLLLISIDLQANALRIATYNLWNPIFEEKYSGQNTWNQRLPFILENIISSESDICLEEVGKKAYLDLIQNAEINKRYMAFYISHFPSKQGQKEGRDGLAFFYSSEKVTFIKLIQSLDGKRPTHRRDFYVDLKLNEQRNTPVRFRIACTHRDSEKDLTVGNKQLSALVDDILQVESDTLNPIIFSFVVCHGGPAAHFATFAEALTNKGYSVQIHATELARSKFQERAVKVDSTFSLDNLTADEEDKLANAIAKTCRVASIIITDLGHIFDVKLQKALNVHAFESCRFAYYDNPEPFVPGGYSSTAAEVIEVAEGILFANDHLAKAKIYSAPEKEINFTNKKRFGIGYYPVSQAEKIAEKRKSDHDTARSTFLMKNAIEDKGQKVLVYFGGNNEEYFLKAFPAFLSFVAETSEQIEHTVIVIQQHPGAKIKNLDGQQVESWLKEFGGQARMPKMILSDFSSDNAQVLADAAFYYQTSIGPQFVLVGIPTIQIGHETYQDILVSNHFALTGTSADDLAQIIGGLEKMDKIPQEEILSRLGFKEDWLNRLENITKESTPSKEYR